MKTNNVNTEFQKNHPKPSFKPEQETLLIETTKCLFEKLTGLNKFAINEIVNGDKLYGVNVLDDLNADFYIGGDKEKFLYSCNFGYYIDEDKKKILQITAYTQDSFLLKDIKRLDFTKRQISYKWKREKIAIWIATNLFEDFGTEEELKNFFFHTEFADSHSFLWWSDM